MTESKKKQLGQQLKNAVDKRIEADKQYAKAARKFENPSSKNKSKTKDRDRG